MSFTNAYTIGAMRDLVVESVTSEATGRVIEHAFNHELESYWSPSTTANQDIAVSLQMASLIPDSDDSDFTASSGNWANVDMTAFGIGGGVMSISATVGQTCELAATGLGEAFKPGEVYQITLDSTTANITLKTDAETIGAITVDTQQRFTFTCASWATKIIIEATGSPLGDIDNFYIYRREDRFKVDGYALFIENTFLDHAPDTDPTLTIQYSDDGANWTQFDSQTLSNLRTNYLVTDRLILKDGLTAQYRPFWRFRLIDMATALHVNQFFLTQSHTLSRSSVYPESTPQTFGTKIQNLPHDRIAVNVGYSESIRKFTRRYRTGVQSVHDAIETIFQLSAGAGMPLVLKEGTDYIVAQMLNNRFDPTLIEFEFYEFVLQFVELRSVTSGRSF